MTCISIPSIRVCCLVVLASIFTCTVEARSDTTKLDPGTYVIVITTDFKEKTGKVVSDDRVDEGRLNLEVVTSGFTHTIPISADRILSIEITSKPAAEAPPPGGSSTSPQPAAAGTPQSNPPQRPRAVVKYSFIPIIGWLGEEVHSDRDKTLVADPREKNPVHDIYPDDDHDIASHIEYASKKGMHVVVLYLSSSGGFVDEAKSLCKTIQDHDNMTFVAIVNTAAGAIVPVAFACDYILIEPGGKLGGRSGSSSDLCCKTSEASRSLTNAAGALASLAHTNWSQQQSLMKQMTGGGSSSITHQDAAQHGMLEHTFQMDARSLKKGTNRDRGKCQIALTATMKGKPLVSAAPTGSATESPDWRHKNDATKKMRDARVNWEGFQEAWQAINSGETKQTINGYLDTGYNNTPWGNRWSRGQWKNLCGEGWEEYDKAELALRGVIDLHKLATVHYHRSPAKSDAMQETSAARWLTEVETVRAKVKFADGTVGYFPSSSSRPRVRTR